MGRYTHAVIARVPADPKLPATGAARGGARAGVDLNLARRQHEALCDVLRRCGLDVIELQPEETADVHCLWLDAQAVVAGGTALITRPGSDHGDKARLAEMEYVLRDLTWQLEVADEHIDGQPVVLNGSDVLFTGKELFVGLRRCSADGESARRKHHATVVGTNMAGAVALARAFPDLPVVPVAFDGDRPLKHYVAVASGRVLARSPCDVAQAIVKRIESESSQRFETLTLQQEGAAACLNVNGHLIHRADWADVTQKYGQLSAVTAGVWPVDVSELLKLGGSLPQYCLLVRQLRNVTKTMR